MTETFLRKKLVKALREVGAEVIPYVGSLMGQQGTADIFVAHKMWHGWIEFKGPNTKIKPLQIRFINRQLDRNVNALFCRMLDERTVNINESHLWTWDNGWELLSIFKEECDL